MKTIDQVASEMATIGIYNAVLGFANTQLKGVLDKNDQRWLITTRTTLVDLKLKTSLQLTKTERMPELSVSDEINFEIVKSNLDKYKEGLIEISTKSKVEIHGSTDSFIRTTELELKPELIEPLKDEAELYIKSKPVH